MKTTGEGRSSLGLADTNLTHSREDDMNMNIDDPYDHRELNTVVNNYVMAEFVAVPPNFDIHSHLSMRENVGIFQVEKMDLRKAQIFTDAIKHSAVFNSMNNALIDPNICFFVLQLFQELGLVVKSIDNLMRRGMSDKIYMHWAKKWRDGRYNYVRGQEVLRINFLIINVVHFLNDAVYKEAIKAMEEVQKLQAEIDSMDYDLDNM